MADVLVIGVGNDFRGDDAAGLLVARALAARAGEALTVLELPGEGTELMAAWQGRAHVIIADAARSGAKVGSHTRLDAGAVPVPRGFFSYSTHAFGLAEAVETARNLNCLPAKLVIYAIEGRAFAQGAPMSPEIEKAVAATAAAIMWELAGPGR